MCLTTFCLRSRRLHIKSSKSYKKIHKLLHPSQMRWLCLQVVTCLLGQMLALILFFKKLATEDRVSAAEAILEKLSNPSTKIYLEFMSTCCLFFTNLYKENNIMRHKRRLACEGWPLDVKLSTVVSFLRVLCSF